MGIYEETEEDYGSVLDPYRRSAQIIEDSNLDYTIIHPAWFTDGAEIDYKLTSKGEVFQGEVLFGSIWSREEERSARDRSLVTVTAWLARGILDSSLQFHL